MAKISIVIITFNEEKNLPRCLESVKKIADEIIVMDSHSTDNTVAIARSFGATVYLQPFLGHVQQKNAAVSKAGFDWVLSLDADEALSPELERNVAAIKERLTFPAFRVSRFTNYCGKWIRHCGWYPDKKIRLFNKNKGEWTGENPHDQWELYEKNEPIGNLRGDLLHFSYYTISDHLKQIESFTEIAAQAAVAKGKDCSLLKIWLGPKWKFFSDFILRLGILDGYHGYLVCKYSSWASFAKYTKIRQYARNKRAGEKK